MKNTCEKELRPYLMEPKAMIVGVPGKTGYLNMVFELDSSGKSILRHLSRRVPIIVQQALYFDEEMPEMPCVYILSSGGQNVDGDRYSQIITMRKDAFAFISTGAATKLAEMRYNHSAMRQIFALDEGAYLEFLPEPTIPCKNTRFISNSEFIVHPTATLFYSEIFTAGRKYYGNGELFRYDLLSLCSHGKRPDDTPLFHEKMVITPQSDNVRHIGVMHDYDVFADAFIMTPRDKADVIYEQIKPFIDRNEQTALGIIRLPNDCGLNLKILGKETSPVKALMREICSIVRKTIKGKTLPDEFPWR